MNQREDDQASPVPNGNQADVAVMLRDAYEEALDLAVYLRGAIEERDNIA